MTTLYVLANTDRSTVIARQALTAWRTDTDPFILHLNNPDRMTVLLRLIGDERIALGKDCFAIDADDAEAWADFNAFLHALRTYERANDAYPTIVRSFNCRF